MAEDLRARLSRLVAPLRPGSKLHDAELIELSTELGLRLRFEHRGEPLDIELTPLPSPRRFALKTGTFGIGYRTEGDHHRVDVDAALALCRAIAERVKANESAMSAAAIDAPRVREVEVERLLERAGWGAERFYTLSPYVGCVIGCRFCYAQSNLAPLRRWAGLPEVPWGSWVDVRVNAPEVLAAELVALPPRPIKLCPIVSDPYQSLESRYDLTGRCLDVLSEHSFPTLLLTRSELVLRDVHRLQKLDAWVGVSLPTIDDAVRRDFEPRGASVDRRIDVLSELKRAGIRTFAVVQPMLPGPIDALADALAEHAGSVSIDVLRGEEGAVDDFRRHPGSRDDEWQRARADELSDALRARGVEVWNGELPPALL